MSRWYFRVFTCLIAHISDGSDSSDSGPYIQEALNEQYLDSMIDWDGYHDELFRQGLFRDEQVIFKKKSDAAKTI